MTYRSFEIYADENLYKPGYSYVHDDYDGSPDGNDNRCGFEKTIEDCKRAIDDWYFEKTQYRVHTLTTITKHWFLSDAIRFAERFKGRLEILVDGHELGFDSI